MGLQCRPKPTTGSLNQRSRSSCAASRHAIGRSRFAAEKGHQSNGASQGVHHAPKEDAHQGKQRERPCKYYILDISILSRYSCMPWFKAPNKS